MSKFSDATFYLSPSGYKEGFIFPQKPLSSNGDVTFTRAGSAWRTNLEGQIEESPYNLLSYSEDFSNAIWGSGTGGTGVSPVKSYNTVIAPNGTLTADTIVFDRGAGNTLSDLSIIQQSFTDTAVTTYTFSVWVKASTVSDVGKQIFLRIGASGALPPTTLTSDWVRISTTQTNTTAVSAFVQFGNRGTVTSGNSVSVDIWGAQIVRGSLHKNYLATTNRQNFPRIDYSLGTGNLLLEPQRTNLLLNSILSGGGSTPTSWTLAASTGTNTVVTSTKNTSCTAYNFIVNSQRQILTQYVAVTSGVSYSFSVYIESVSTNNSIQEFLVCAVLPGTINYYKNNVGISGSDVVTSNAVYTLVYVPSSTGSVELRIGAGCSSNQTANVTLSMPQFEQGTYSTTFIPTTTASATRLVDTFNRSNLYTNNLISASGGTWLLDLRNSTPYIRDVFSQSISLGYFFNSVGGDGFALTFGQSTSTGFQFRKYVGGVETTLYGSSTGTVKLLIKWNGSTADLFVNGVKQVSATVFTATTMSYLFATGASTPVNILQTALWNTPLTDAQCIELTS